MLDDEQITEAECIYLSCDSGGLSDEAIIKLREYIYNKCHEQYIYLEWLLTRWTKLRNDYTHLPTKVNKTNTGITFTMIKPKKTIIIAVCYVSPLLLVLLHFRIVNLKMGTGYVIIVMIINLLKTQYVVCVII
jgi:hypothetical protein